MIHDDFHIEVKFFISSSNRKQSSIGHQYLIEVFFDNTIFKILIILNLGMSIPGLQNKT